MPWRPVTLVWSVDLYGTETPYCAVNKNHTLRLTRVKKHATDKYYLFMQCVECKSRSTELATTEGKCKC